MNGHDSCNVLAGFGEADITPDWPTELVGFLRADNTSKGVLHPLISQVLVWGTGDERFCIVTIDSIGFTKELANGLRDIVSGRIGSSRDKVMVCFSLPIPIRLPMQVRIKNTMNTYADKSCRQPIMP